MGGYIVGFLFMLPFLIWMVITYRAIWEKNASSLMVMGAVCFVLGTILSGNIVGGLLWAFLGPICICLLCVPVLAWCGFAKGWGQNIDIHPDDL